MRGDQSRDWLAMSVGPALECRGDRIGHACALGAAVDEKSLAVAEDQIEKWLLIVGAARLPKDVEIGVVFVKTEVGLPSRAGVWRFGPTWRQGTAFEAGAVRLRRLGADR